MQYWLIVTSTQNFKHDRDVLKFKEIGGLIFGKL